MRSLSLFSISSPRCWPAAGSVLLAVCLAANAASAADHRCQVYLKVFQCDGSGSGDQAKSQDFCTALLSGNTAGAFHGAKVTATAIAHAQDLCAIHDFNQRRKKYCTDNAQTCAGAGGKANTPTSSCSGSARDCMDQAGKNGLAASQDLNSQSQDYQSTITAMNTTLGDLQAAASDALAAWNQSLQNTPSNGGDRAAQTEAYTFDQSLVKQAFQGKNSGDFSLSDAQSANDPGIGDVLSLAVAAQELRSSAQQGLQDISHAQNSLAGIITKTSDNRDQLGSVTSSISGRSAPTLPGGDPSNGPDSTITSRDPATLAAAGANGRSGAAVPALGAVPAPAMAPTGQKSNSAKSTSAASAQSNALRERLARALSSAGASTKIPEADSAGTPGVAAILETAHFERPPLVGGPGPTAESSPETGAAFSMRGSENDYEIRRLLGEWDSRREPAAETGLLSTNSPSLFERVHRAYRAWSTQTAP